MAEGLNAHIGTLQDRLQRLTDRASKRRQIARDAMLEVDIKKIAAPDFTVSVRAGVRALVVADQAAIPADYWVPCQPRLDRIDLVGALKRGTAVTGAQLSNPEPVLSVRVK